ncbi:hypothetical protein BSK58_13110 [Paenibacillus odorifer]|nr:hypothetical protein BSK58_13110 [Paenibacillus odorifer]
MINLRKPVYITLNEARRTIEGIRGMCNKQIARKLQMETATQQLRRSAGSDSGRTITIKSKRG